MRVSQRSPSPFVGQVSNLPPDRAGWKPAPRRRRPAVTLIELLVVMAIIAGLAALAVAIFPRLQDSQRVAKGADVVQGQLFLAKQMALRDQLPRGLRLVRDPADGGRVHGVQLIEQPQPYVKGQLEGVQPAPAPNNGLFLATFGGGPDFRTGGAVQAGDFLDLTIANDTSPALHQVVSVPSPNQLLLRSRPAGVNYPCVYRVIRAPRPMIGESEVNLPRDVIIDLAPGTSIIPADGGNYDVLFAPSGKVVRTAGTQGKVILWLRDPNNNAMAGEQVLVVVYTRTGAIATHPVNASGGDPYSYVKDGKSSGM